MCVCACMCVSLLSGVLFAHIAMAVSCVCFLYVCTNVLFVYHGPYRLAHLTQSSKYSVVNVWSNATATAVWI